MRKRQPTYYGDIRPKPITYTPLEAIERALTFQRPAAAVDYLRKFLRDLDQPQAESEVG